MNKFIVKEHTHLMFKFTFLSFLLAAILVSCKDDDTLPTKASALYPLEVGQYQIYDIKQVVYAVDVPDSTSTSWQERDVVDRVSQQSGSAVTYIVARYQRKSTEESWKKVKEYAVEKSPDKIIQTVDNTSVVPLIFPVRDKFTWNGNMYNSQDEQNFVYMLSKEPFSVDTKTFPNTTSVSERDETSVINNYVSLKVYAPEVGLIFEENTAFEYCQNDDCIGSYKVESGSHRVKKINSWGTLQ